MLLASFLLTAITANLPIANAVCALESNGKDDTAAVETCLRANPAGNTVLPPGVFIVTRPLIKNRNQNLRGSGSKATIIKCEMQKTSCVVAADSAGGPNNSNYSEFADLTLQGTGASSDSTGVFLGGDPQGKLITSAAFGDGVNFTNVRITGFRHGISWGNNAWGNKFLHTLIFGNDVGLFVPPGLTNSGEAIGITDCNLFNNSGPAIEDHSNFQWLIQGTSFDYNKLAIVFFGATVHILNCHFEQPRAQVFFEPFGASVFSIRDSTILIQSTTGSEDYIADFWPQSITLTIDDVTIWSNHPVKSLLHIQGAVSSSITSLNGNGNNNIHSLSNIPLQNGSALRQPFR